MAQRIESPRVTIPANTPKATPVTIPFTWREGIVTVIAIDIPPGPSGLVGFFITQSGNQIIPNSVGDYIVSDDYRFEWPVEDYPTGAKWALVGYNTDAYPHTIQFHFQINELVAPRATFPAPIAFG